MTEVPLVYPGLVSNPRRYAVHSDSLKLQRLDLGSIFADPNAPPPPEDSLPGAASVSSFDLMGSEVLVTTSARIESPGVLSIALSWTQDPSAPPSLMELDLPSLYIGPIVRVQAFAHHYQDQCIKLVIVDYHGTFVSITLTKSLHPTEEPVQILKTDDLVKDTDVLEKTTGSAIQSTMVSFLSSTKAVLALPPFLLSVDLVDQTSVIWSQSQCLEDMAARASTLGAFLNFGGRMLGMDVGEVLDMPPTTALCLASTANPLLDPVYCITLHKDSTLRKWKLDPSATLAPIEVTHIESEFDEKIADHIVWNDHQSNISMCARLYDDSYSLALHVRTAEMENDAADFTSPCHLLVFQEEHSSETGATKTVLHVPNEAETLVGMTFLSGERDSVLSAVFQTHEGDCEDSLQVVYRSHPGGTVHSEPTIDHVRSLDTFASQERARMQSLSVGTAILESHPRATISELLSQVDSAYGKIMFRPIFPRGTGTVLPPSKACIRRALGKLLHGHRGDNEASIELETIKAMYQWRVRERSTINNVVSMDDQPDDTEDQVQRSVYESFVHEEEVVDDDTNMAGETFELEETQDIDKSLEVESHENRWKTFLLQVWEEERIMRLPLCVSWLDSSPSQIIVRAEITTSTALEHRPAQVSSSSGSVSKLDPLALKILFYIEQNNALAQSLYALESEVISTTAKAASAVASSSAYTDLVLKLTSLATRSSSHAISNSELDWMENSIPSMSPEELIAWVKAAPTSETYDQLGIKFCSESQTNELLRSGGSVDHRRVPNGQLRHASCSLSIRCSDSMRRLHLARFLMIVGGVGSKDVLKRAAFRAYLNSMGVLWVSSQQVKMPAVFRHDDRRADSSFRKESSPPAKRPSLGDDASSIMASLSTSMTTLLDVVMVEISDSRASAGRISASPGSAAMSLCAKFFHKTFLNTSVSPSLPFQLTELSIFPTPKDTSKASDYPRLALRLLAPYLAFQVPDDVPDVIVARKDALAECMLLEAQCFATDIEAKKRMQRVACEMLLPKTADVDPLRLQPMVIHALEMADNMDHVDRTSQVDLIGTLAYFLDCNSQIEIERLCQLATARRVFTLVAHHGKESFTGEEHTALTSLATVLLHLSREINRLNILERDISTRSLSKPSDPSILLRFISNAIQDMSQIFPEQRHAEMPEFELLYSRLFQQAILSRHWREALLACVGNPNSESRKNGFERLVTNMLDMGALAELLGLCTDLVPRSNQNDTMLENSKKDVDLYEIVSGILTRTPQRDMYNVRHSVTGEARNNTDLQGALYSLHVKHKQWRRAAQAMDLRFLRAQRAFVAEPQKSAMHQSSRGVRNSFAVQDLVLSSIAGLNAMQLVQDDAHRFLVSGENGPYVKIQVEDFDTERHGALKRFRDDTKSEAVYAYSNRDRLAAFMTCEKLELRAVRSIARKVLFTCGSLLQGFSEFFEEGQNEIKDLFYNGFYLYGLLALRAWGESSQSLTGSSKPSGTDVYDTVLSHLFDRFLVPLAVGTEPVDFVKPSLRQLHYAIDFLNPAYPTFVAVSRHWSRCDIGNVLVSNAAMLLTQKLTVLHSSRESPVAVSVAKSFLSQAGRVPTWLERLLMGADVRLQHKTNGLFALRPSSELSGYLGDPSALVTLYAKNGLLVEACNVISTILVGDTSAEAEAKAREAPVRLLEKGEVDFVPYSLIDMVWNLIEVILRKKVLSDAVQGGVIDARTKMENALKQHQAMLRVSEAGLRSARLIRH